MKYGLEDLSKEYFNGVGEQHFNEFHDVTTPEGNKISGYICTKRNYHLGSMVITSVNNEPTIQFVQSMPRIHYPNDSTSTYHLKTFEHIYCYEKLDGTCIIMYNLFDQDGKFLETLFKTRNTVVAEDHILDLVMRCNLNKYYRNLSRNPRLVYYFELYGMDNYHMIRYNKTIDMKCIAVSENGCFKDYFMNVDTAQVLFWISKEDDSTYALYYSLKPETFDYIRQKPIFGIKDLETVYQYLCDLMEEINQKNIKQFGYPALEGGVLQGKTEDEQHLFLKLKPKGVKTARFHSDKVPYSSIRKEVLKIFEEYSLEYIKEKSLEDKGWYRELVNGGLLEDYSDEKVHGSQTRVKRVFDEMWEAILPSEDDGLIAESLVKDNPDKSVKELMQVFGREYPHLKSHSGSMFRLLKKKMGIV